MVGGERATIALLGQDNVSTADKERAALPHPTNQ